MRRVIADARADRHRLRMSGQGDQENKEQTFHAGVALHGDCQYDSRMAGLTSKQKQYLKGLAHPLAPVVRVGRGRVSESVVAETKKSLASHELIKVRIDTDDSAARKELAAQLAS